LYLGAGGVVTISTGVGHFQAPVGQRQCQPGDVMTLVVSADIVTLDAEDATATNRVVGQIRFYRRKRKR
jgi:hypothetical protein